MSSLSKTISLKDFRLHLPDVIEQIATGKSFTVFKRSKPIFQINPIEDEENGWSTIIDFTEIDKHGVAAEDVVDAFESLRKE